MNQADMETAGVFLGFFALGLAAMAPSVTFGDAGEFAACAATLSLAHAPSYPAAALAGKALGTLLPWGNWAFRTNLLSCLCSAGALALLVAAMRRAGLSRVGRLGGAFFLGFSSLWRYQAGVTEVFALHALALCVLLWVWCGHSGRMFAARPMAALGLTAGLGLANHHTLLLAAPACGWGVWRSWRLSGAGRGPLARGVLWALLGCGLGLLIYAFLPLRARADPPLDWGHPVDLQRFLRVLLRKDYGSLSLTVEGRSAFSAAAVASQCLRYLRATAHGWGATGLGLCALGLCALRKPDRVGLGLWVFFLGPFFLILGNPPFDSQTSGALERFYMASWLGLAFWAAAGIEAVGARLRWAAWALVLVPVLGGWFGREAWWLRQDLAAYDYGRSVLKSLPPGATLIMDGGDDTFYTTAFLTLAERRRPDVTLHDRGGVVFRHPYGPGFRFLSRPEKEARRAAVESALAAGGRLFYSTLNARLLSGYELQPWGLLRRPGSAGPRAPEPWQIYPLRWQEGLLAGHYRYRALVGFYPVAQAASAAAAGRPREALRFLDWAWELGPDVIWLRAHVAYAAEWIGFESAQRQDWAAAEAAYLASLRADPGRADACISLGVAYERTGRRLEAEQAYQRAIRLAPKSFKAYYNLGAFYWGLSRWAEAAEAFAAAAHLAPEHAEALRYAAQARIRGMKR